MSESVYRAHVVSNSPKDGLFGTVQATGETYVTNDPKQMAKWLFEAGIRYDQVLIPDWGEGDIAPTPEDKIVLLSRLRELGQQEPRK